MYYFITGSLMLDSCPPPGTLLRQTGFSGVDKTVNDFVDDSKYMTSVMLSQAVDHGIQLLRNPLSVSADWLLSQSITIVGGKYKTIAQEVKRIICQINDASELVIHWFNNFEELAFSHTSFHVQSALVLEDMDEPILKDLTEDKLRGVQRLVNQARQLL
ncbi:hypothetical protein HG530_008489 [Fusarium avenaceum]|nr:hypothetical protein HG530_008489 [Fusarium avenaceum]